MFLGKDKFRSVLCHYLKPFPQPILHLRSASRHMFCWSESVRHWHLEEQEQALCRRMGENLTYFRRNEQAVIWKQKGVKLMKALKFFNHCLIRVYRQLAASEDLP